MRWRCNAVESGESNIGDELVGSFSVRLKSVRTWFESKITDRSMSMVLVV